MSSVQLIQDSQKLPIPVSSMDTGCGPLAFVRDKIVEIFIGFAIIVACATVVLPVAAYIYNRQAGSFSPSVIQSPVQGIDPKAERIDKWVRELKGKLASYIQETRKTVRETGIDVSRRDQLNGEVEAILAREGIKDTFLIGIQHPIFQEIMEQNLFADLSKAKTNRKDMEEILLAYGYNEDDFDDVIQKFHLIASLQPLR